MFVDTEKAEERIKYLNSQINKKQTDIKSLISSLTASATPSNLFASSATTGTDISKAPTIVASQA